MNLRNSTGIPTVYKSVIQKGFIICTKYVSYQVEVNIYSINQIQQSRKYIITYQFKMSVQ